MKRFTIIFSALLLLCSCSKPADELKIVSFNIRYNSYENIDGENGWPNRKEAVVRMINEEKPAAIGLQEALIDQLQYLDSCLPEYRRIGVGRDDGEEAGEFMAIYYDTTRLELELDQTLWLSDTPLQPSLGWDAACRRTVTIAFFRDRKSRKVFCYLNTHLDHVGKTARAEGAGLIAALLNPDPQDWVLCDSHTPVILGGDMNSTIDDTIFNAFYNVGLKPAREMTDSISNAITYNGYGKEDGKVIDHFFVKDLKVVSFRTLDGDFGVPYISDHYPIEVVIKL
ncbi:MAG: endonuclease/exonuclease/phosphatase family protein [Bacteroidales bacterium]|nr:endonuclease/exonuclease/phosphatase family protein [Bacteroidales bacterium]